MMGNTGPFREKNNHRAEDQKDHLRVSVPQNNWSELGKAHTLPERQFLFSVKQDNIFA